MPVGAHHQSKIPFHERAIALLKRRGPLTAKLIAESLDLQSDYVSTQLRKHPEHFQQAGAKLLPGSRNKVMTWTLKGTGDGHQ